MQQEPKLKEIQSTDLAKGLLDLRLEKRMTVNELSRMFSIAPVTICKIEDGIIWPDFDTLLKYAKFFKVKIIIS